MQNGWSPADALKFLDGAGLADADKEKILGGNARRILDLVDPLKAAAE